MKICPTCRNSFPDLYEICPHDGTQLTAVEESFAPGAVLRGKYEVLNVLGKGGMATVYKVRHLAFHDFAAVKVVHPELLNDGDFLKRFRNEAIVARQLKHPNAVRIEDFDYADDGRPFITMEYVDGPCLYDLRKQSPRAWPIDISLSIAAGVASALEAAHALGIVHRDIKPSNLLLCQDGNGQAVVKVLDFGIAKTRDQAFLGMTSVKTQASLVIGTPEYMSPEQATGSEDGQIDGRSDLYSLGMVLYELVTGAHPFQADTPIAMLVHHMQTRPDAPHLVEGSVPPAVSAIILKSLQKRPEERFQSAHEMLLALQDPQGWLQNNGGMAALPESPSQQPAVAAAQPADPDPATPGPATTQRAANGPASRAMAGATPSQRLPVQPKTRSMVHDPVARAPQRSAGSRMTSPQSAEKSRGIGGLLALLLLLAAGGGAYWYFAGDHADLTSSKFSAKGSTTPDAVSAFVQFCDGNNCQSHFSPFIIRRVRLRVDLHRATAGAREDVPLRLVMYKDEAPIYDKNLGTCTLPAGGKDASCDTHSAITTNLQRPAQYRVEVFGKGLVPLGSASVLVSM